MQSFAFAPIAVICALCVVLPAAFAAPRIGLNVGTNPSGTDVAVNGDAVVPWNFNADTFVITSDIDEFNFYISLNETATVGAGLPLSQDFQASVQSANTTNTEVSVQVIGDLPRVSIGYENQKLVTVTFSCHHTSYSILQLQFSMQLFDPVIIFMNKSCNVLEPRHFFSMSNNLTLNSNVVRDGVVHEGFFLGVDAQTTQTVFYVYMEPATGTQYYNVSQLLTDELQVVANITYFPTDQIAPDLEDGYSLLTINYNCVGPGGRSDIYVLIDIPGFKSIELGYTKDCPTVPSNNNNGGGGGWSKAGIAFFVLFIIGTVACLAGCAYNRLQLRKDGIDIIPGARSFANCVNQARSSSSGYSQQTNTNSNTNDTLMHSDYQSNL